MITSTKLSVVASILIIVSLIAYVYVEHAQVEETFAIQYGEDELRVLLGESDRFGLEKESWTDAGYLVINKPSNYAWYIKGVGQSLSGKILTIASTHDRTGQQLSAFSSDITSLDRPVGDLDFYSSVEMTFPKKGVWSLDVFVDDRSLGTIKVNARDHIKDRSRHYHDLRRELRYGK
ncbi:hypothetical protein [Ammoniphilus oxalaticus]|nr:hypothetical protein [Ammoniphilus oxalaticus]